MNTRTASTLPKSIQELLRHRRRELLRIQWDETMTNEDGTFYFQAVYEEVIGGKWKTAKRRTVEHTSNIIIRDWCPHAKYK